jgi:hypothetical protein
VDLSEKKRIRAENRQRDAIDAVPVPDQMVVVQMVVVLMVVVLMVVVLIVVVLIVVVQIVVVQIVVVLIVVVQIPLNAAQESRSLSGTLAMMRAVPNGVA